MKDLTKRRFTHLVALYRVSKKTAQGSYFWKCQCDCGNVIDIPAVDLVSLNTKSCGCLKNSTTPYCKPGKRNKSGVIGVRWSTQSKKWQAYIYHDGKNHYLGFFDDFGDAVCARKNAEKHLKASE